MGNIGYNVLRHYFSIEGFINNTQDELIKKQSKVKLLRTVTHSYLFWTLVWNCENFKNFIYFTRNNKSTVIFCSWFFAANQ